jgi:hypothetical protein
MPLPAAAALSKQWPETGLSPSTLNHFQSLRFRSICCYIPVISLNNNTKFSGKHHLFAGNTSPQGGGNNLIFMENCFDSITRLIFQQFLSGINE